MKYDRNGKVVAIELRWLAGGSYQEIEDVFWASTTEAYRSGNKFIDALSNCDQVEIRLPTTVTEYKILLDDEGEDIKDGPVHMGYYPMQLDPNDEEDKIIIDRLYSSVPGKSVDSVRSDPTDVWMHPSLLFWKGVSGVGIDEEFMFGWLSPNLEGNILPFAPTFGRTISHKRIPN